MISRSGPPRYVLKQGSLRSLSSAQREKFLMGTKLPFPKTPQTFHQSRRLGARRGAFRTKSRVPEGVLSFQCKTRHDLSLYLVAPLFEVRQFRLRNHNYILEGVPRWQIILTKKVSPFFCDHFQIWRDTFIPCFIFTNISTS